MIANRAISALALLISSIVLVAASGCGGKKNDEPVSSGNLKPLETTPNHVEALAPPKTPAAPAPDEEAKKKDDALRAQKEKERIRIESEKKQFEETLRTASLVQTPPLGKGVPNDPTKSNCDEFAARMRDLTGNEFKFRDASKQVYKSTFSQKDQNYSDLIKFFFARNAIVQPGKYDFESGVLDIDFMYWQAIYEEKKFGDGPTSPRVEDTCKLHAAIKIDAATAQKWREAFDKRSLSLTVWYKFKSVEKAEWKQNPRNKAAEQVHNISVLIEVLKIE